MNIRLIFLLCLVLMVTNAVYSQTAGEGAQGVAQLPGGDGSVTKSDVRY